MTQGRCSRRFCCTSMIAAGLGVAALVPVTAAAYSTPSLFVADPVTSGGAGGRVFTGAPADAWGCNVCHDGGVADGYQLVGGPRGTYEVGATYLYELRWPANRAVGVALEVSDRDGLPLGSLRLPPAPELGPEERCAGGGPAARIVDLEDGRAAVVVGACGASLLRVQWTAPMVTRPGALHWGLVDGDGDGTVAGDRVQMAEVSLGQDDDAAGCRVRGTSGTPGWWWWLALVGVGGCWRRRKVRRSVVAVVGSMVLQATTGCATVAPHERGRLAQPDMQLTPDPELDAGPEHALEYREGSAGGFGGGGGGCGCN